jgi:hypothetical protein
MDDMFRRAGEILDGLREIELIVADLYLRFAAAFAADRIFWHDLALDEQKHAELASELKAALLRNGAPFEVGKLNAPALATFRQGVGQQMIRLGRGEISRRSALFIARDLERTLVEHCFYQAIRSENPDYITSRGQIEQETEAHLQKLENYILTLFP